MKTRISLYLASPILAALLLGASPFLHADVTMPAIFGDHMVLQQGGTLPVWGMAATGEEVTVTAGAATAKTTAGVDGKWRVDLAALLEPAALLRQAEQEGDHTSRLALMEEAKTLPLGAVWQEHCRRQNVPGDHSWLAEVKNYERSVLASRN